MEDIIGELFARDMKGLLEFTRGRRVGNIRRAPQPVIAAIQGVAVGAGAVMATAADASWVRKPDLDLFSSGRSVRCRHGLHVAASYCWVRAYV